MSAATYITKGYASSRPVYENADTLRAEAAVAAVLEKAWNCKAVKLPRSYRVDYALLRDGVIVAWVEVKCRGKRYDTYMLSLHKFAEVVGLAERTDIPALLVVQWPAGVFYARLEGEAKNVGIGGRADRGDAEDVEPVVMLPGNTFRRVPA